ncbi:hypothetical protein AVEN_34195-1 [Araneus ventricosus]|uniref:Uncharacterized protein n=1 Tax=Araneus ventricosus TaxID=182803 RepID=A0A4Y2GHE7_ARAVE|nr:hypothetical protein AVEN_34195-1 [Araneus ventricosus]
MYQRSHPDISHPSEFLHGTHASQCDHRVRSLPKPRVHHLYSCGFQECWSDGICCAVLSSESGLVCEEYRSPLLSGPGNVFSCPTYTGPSLSSVAGEHTQLVALNRDLHCEGIFAP